MAFCADAIAKRRSHSSETVTPKRLRGTKAGGGEIAVVIESRLLIQSLGAARRPKAILNNENKHKLSFGELYNTKIFLNSTAQR